MSPKRIITLGAAIVMTMLTANAQTLCNPINLPYRFALQTDDSNQKSYREAADPTMVVYEGEYYLFASKCGGYYHSTDMLNWTLIHTNLPVEGYAPTAVEHNGNLYFTCSLGGTIGTRAIWVTSDPKSGQWTRVKGAGTTSDLADPMLYSENGEMYLFFGSSGDPNSYIQGYKLGGTSGLRATGEATNLVSCKKDIYGWEVPGDYNENKDASPWLEAAWVTKHDGKYYLQYSSPGTEMKAYNNSVYVGDSPLGPYHVQAHNPMCYRPEGFAAAAGHGSTYQDVYGNYWHVTTATISRRHMFERRLVVYPVFFDSDGEMWAYTGYGDWPMRMPQKKISSPDELHAGWQLLSYGKEVTVSSTATGQPASNAVNEDIRTWWSATSADAGEWLEIDLGGEAEVNAVQVNFADHNAEAWGELDMPYRYRLQGSADGQQWIMLADRSENTIVAPHELCEMSETAKVRYVRIVNVECPYGQFSISGLRVFGTMNRPLPSTTEIVTASRSTSDARTMHLGWKPADNATGYNVRYGIAPDKMYLNYTVFGRTTLTVNSLSTAQTYYVSVDAFNEAGITIGKQVLKVEPGEDFYTSINNTYFPLQTGALNPSIFGEGQYADDYTLTTATYGFGGWQYGGADWSHYDRLVIKLRKVPASGVSFRIFDENNYWSTPVAVDINKKTTTIDLRTEVGAESNRTSPLDLSHIYICGFWSTGNIPIMLDELYLLDSKATSIGDIQLGQSTSDNVYSLTGMLLQNIPHKGIYIMNGKKHYQQ